MIVEGVPTTIGDALRAVAAAILDAGVGDTARLDAELLVGHVTGLDRVGLRVESERVLEPEAWQRLDELVGRRVSGEPIAYLLGSAWFYGREFTVDRRVLVPRPETELLVELALEHFADHATSSTFVDACTGSGCVAVSIAAELDGRAAVHATDLSRDALDVAAINAARHGVDVQLHEGDLLEPVGELRRVAAIVANPPYVEGVDAAGLEPGVRDHEPHVALLLPEGTDARSFYGRLAQQALPLLEPGGLLAVEHGQGQRTMVAAALHDAGYEAIEGHDDLAGIDRVVVGYRPGGGS
ncbi:MAG: peptide chain release factor N(5)-glutamine methyltransferase [Thermoleophilia bacterium]|nr:peptide chain release factor N(5)-glutamine methyltransferase [Thermoleophilia bacterium]